MGTSAYKGGRKREKETERVCEKEEEREWERVGEREREGEREWERKNKRNWAKRRERGRITCQYLLPSAPPAETCITHTISL